MEAGPYLLDSSVCIAILRNRPKIDRLPPLRECRISQIVVAELWVGAKKSARPEQNARLLEEFLGGFTLLDFDETAARHYGEIRADLETKGSSIGPLDLLIAAHARSVDLTILTANIREFRRVPDLHVQLWLPSRP